MTHDVTMQCIISIHAPHARSDAIAVYYVAAIVISIHAPHARSDPRNGTIHSALAQISIHAPHARSDCSRHARIHRADISIHAPHARSDLRHYWSVHLFPYFNPRSSCEERRWLHRLAGDTQTISIHAPHARSDLRLLHPVRPHVTFQSTLLMRGATSLVLGSRKPGAFQSTLLMRGATGECEDIMQDFLFQSTLLMRGATGQAGTKVSAHHISIHAPHARSDTEHEKYRLFLDISIHAPHARSDRRFHQLLIRAISISIHAPHARSDRASCRSARRGRHFNPRSSCEERLMPSYSKFQTILFQSTLLMRGATCRLTRICV